MMGMVLVLVMAAVAAALDVLGFSGVVAAIAKGAFFVVPVVFTVSLLWGLSFRRRI